MSRDIELIRALNRVERSVDVECLNYAGIKYWPILRNKLYISNLYANVIPPARSRVRSTWISRKFRLIWGLVKSYTEILHDRRNRASIHGKADILYLTHPTCRRWLDGKALDTFFLPLIYWSNELPRPPIFLGLEHRPSDEYRIPRGEPTAYIQAKTNAWGIRAQIRIRVRRIVLQAEALYKIKRAMEASGYSGAYIDRGALRADLEFVVIASEFFKRLIRKVQPKMVLVVTYYSPVGMALMHAANQLGIPTFDIQHGVQGLGHNAYSRFSSVPAGGWTLLPKVFLNWTQEDADNITGWGADEHVGRLLGVPWHRYVREGGRGDECLRLIHSKQISAGAGDMVLVSLQPYADNTKYLLELRMAIDSLRLKNVFWLIRLHPGMSHKQDEIVKALESKNADIRLATEAPLPVILDRIILHVTRNSSVVIEAAISGVVSLVEAGCDLYENYEQTGLVERLSSQESLEEAVFRKLFAVRAEGSSEGDAATPANPQQEFLRLLAEYDMGRA
jgi:hypothetical protein